MTALRLGTRGSALARAQSGAVADRIRAELGREVEGPRRTVGGERQLQPAPAPLRRDVRAVERRDERCDVRRCSAGHRQAVEHQVQAPLRREARELDGHLRAGHGGHEAV